MPAALTLIDARWLLNQGSKSGYLQSLVEGARRVNHLHQILMPVLDAMAAAAGGNRGVGGGGGERRDRVRERGGWGRRARHIEQMDRGSRVFLRSPTDCVPAYQHAVACHIG